MSAKLFPQQGSGRSSDFPDQSCATPSQPFGQWHLAAFVPGYSGGPVHDSNVVPSCAPHGAPERERSIPEQRRMSREKSGGSGPGRRAQRIESGCMQQEFDFHGVERGNNLPGVGPMEDSFLIFFPVIPMNRPEEP